MTTLNTKRILLGVTGSIAAYKSPDVVRRLREAGAEVRVVMTPSACKFITPLTLQAVSGHAVREDFLDPESEAAMGHIALARWADAVLVAPASADVLARLAQGRANDPLTAVCLATRAPVAVAPAMNRAMWENAATRENCEQLRRRGVRFLGPDEGAQACGEMGEGRMSASEALADGVAALFASGLLSGLEVLITAGPTQEALDPMRFLSNRSSGKMGFALARAAVEAGARVTLVSGPVSQPTPERVQRVDVRSADEMLDAVMSRVSACDIFIGAAAVADYRPARKAPEKLRREAGTIELVLEPTPDIAARVGALEARPFTVGFAAETHALEESAQAKRKAKHVDLIAANRIGESEEGAPIGFESDENALTVFWEGGRAELEQGPKSRLARELVALIAPRYHEAKSPA